MDMGLKIVFAAMMLFMAWRLWPAAKEHFENLSLIHI